MCPAYHHFVDSYLRSVTLVVPPDTSSRAESHFQPREIRPCHPSRKDVKGSEKNDVAEQKEPSKQENM